MDKAMKVEVLMATRNSARFIDAMIDSLICQNFSDFQLIISDDASSDNTLEIIAGKVSKFKWPPRIIKQETSTGSAKNNFSYLMTQSSADYVFFADHDDIWLPNKIAVGVAALQEAERTLGGQMPILYHSDLRVIDGEGNPLSPSYWKFKAISPDNGKSLKKSLMYATVTGCAMAMNKALVSIANPIPEAAYMHDWWANIVAAARGVVIADPNPQIEYRIHESNVSRPRSQTLFGAFRQFDRIFQMRSNALSKYNTGVELARLHMNSMDKKRSMDLEGFLRIRKTPFGVRQYKIVKNNYLDMRSWRDIVKLLFV